MTYGEWLVAGAKPDTPANYAAYVATLDGGMSRAAPPPPPAPLPAAGPPLPPPPLPAGSLTEAGAAANEAVAAKARETAAPFFRGARNLGDTALNWVGLGGVSKALGVRPEPVAKPGMPEEAAPQETKEDKPANYGVPIYLPKEPKGGGVTKAAGPVGSVAVNRVEGHFDPEIQKAKLAGLSKRQAALDAGLDDIDRQDAERHAAEDKVAKFQATYDSQARDLEAKRVAEYNAFQQRVSDKEAEARAQAPARAISSLFSAVAIGLGAYASSITKTPNVALDLYKHAADEEARRLERDSRDENNYYHRMLQEFGDKKQALAMTKIGFLEQGKAAFEKQAANTKSAHARQQYMEAIAGIDIAKAEYRQEMLAQREGQQSSAATLAVPTYGSAPGVAGLTAITSRATSPARDGAPVAAGGAPAAAAEQGQPVAPGGARQEQAAQQPSESAVRAATSRSSAAPGRPLDEGGPEGQFWDMWRERESKKAKPAASAPSALVKRTLPSARASLVTPTPRPGVPLAKDGLPVIANDGRPRMPFEDYERADKHLTHWLDNAGNQKLVDTRAKIYALENRFNVFSPKQWASYDAAKARDFMGREASAAKAADTKGGFVSGQIGTAFSSYRSNSVEADLLKESPQFQQMYIAHRAMVQADVVREAGKTLTGSEKELEQLTGIMRNDPRLFMQAYHMKIRDPFELRWKAATSTWTPDVKRIWDASFDPRGRHTNATGAEVVRGQPLGRPPEATTASGEERLSK